MQERHLYEYAVIRVVPRVEREEFINVGVILFSKRADYIKAQYVIDEKKLACFSSELDIDALRENLKAFDHICRGNSAGTTSCKPDKNYGQGQRVALGYGNKDYIASLEVPERFRWLTAVRSSSIQTSRPHPGFSTDLDTTFERLFKELVL